MSEEEKKQETRDEESHNPEASTDVAEETPDATEETEETTEDTTSDTESKSSDESGGNGQAEKPDFGILDLDEIQTISQDTMEERQEETEEEAQMRSLMESTLRDIGEDQITSGRVIAVNEREVVVDIGFKAEGIIPRHEFEEDEVPEIGSDVDVFLDVLEDEEGQLILSKKKADFMRQWETVSEAAAEDEIVQGTIIRRVKGGMMVDVNGVNCFLPGSQIDVRPIQDFDAYVGQTFDFKIVKINEMRKNVVLSRKVLLEENLKERRKELLKDIEVGQVLQGRVKNITDFGVFVDLGGIDGLVHITDISWGRVNHPSEMVSLEEVIDVMVIDYDEEKQRVSLGLKQLKPHPWDNVEEKYPV
ncbi:MAG: S1 RNA-binding domain-containing protein, partial [Candidatus Marinimicrobia bacterium]|nr:S1 RNA-binding domain-containing protein [Candidatus Neomarinimicrobiota bacterium]